MSDASFLDGADHPLRLKALNAEDVNVISTLLQDAVFPAHEMQWDTKQRRFAILLNRFRWEDIEKAEAQGHAYERVQTVLAIEDVQKVRSKGIEPHDGQTVHSLLSIAFNAGEDGGGNFMLHLAGDAAIAVTVEAIELILQDVTRPYIAPSGKRPAHPE